MMVDMTGCWKILGVLALIGFVIGLITVWAGAAWWVPFAGAVALPFGVAVVAAVGGILLMGSAKH